MKTIIVGGGASGVICALKLKKLKPNMDVVILEQNDRILKKVLKTGNGKCNICNRNIAREYYNDFCLIENNYLNINIEEELESLGIVLKETSLGRIYPYSESATSVVNIFNRELQKAKVLIKTSYEVKNIEWENNIFIINNEDKCDFLIMATGSIAQSRTNGYELVKKLGCLVTKLSPGLVPIITKEKTDHLQGVRVKCSAQIKSSNYEGEILFKKDGLSGILALDISRYVKKDDIVYLDLMPEYNEKQIEKILVDYINDLGLTIKEALEGIFSKMIAFEILSRSKGDLKKVVRNIKELSYTVDKVKDYDEAQIVLGGVKTNEITENFASIKNDHLFILGELLNVDGASGGYNLYFAWLSGIVAANTISKMNEK